MSNDNAGTYYNEWERYLLHTHPKIPADCRRYVLLMFCFALANQGSLGRNSFIGDQRIAEQIGIGRKYLKKYRALAIELGWLTPNGNKRGRVAALDISIPEVQPDVSVWPDDEPKTSVAEPEKPAKPSVTVPDHQAAAKPVAVSDPWAEIGRRTPPTPTPAKRETEAQIQDRMAKTAVADDPADVEVIARAYDPPTVIEPVAGVIVLNHEWPTTEQNLADHSRHNLDKCGCDACIAYRNPVGPWA